MDVTPRETIEQALVVMKVFHGNEPGGGHVDAQRPVQVAMEQQPRDGAGGLRRQEPARVDLTGGEIAPARMIEWAYGGKDMAPLQRPGNRDARRSQPAVQVLPAEFRLDHRGRQMRDRCELIGPEPGAGAQVPVSRARQAHGAIGNHAPVLKDADGKAQPLQMIRHEPVRLVLRAIVVRMVEPGQHGPAQGKKQAKIALPQQPGLEAAVERRRVLVQDRGGKRARIRAARHMRRLFHVSPWNRELQCPVRNGTQTGLQSVVSEGHAPILHNRRFW